MKAALKQLLDVANLVNPTGSVKSVRLCYRGRHIDADKIIMTNLVIMARETAGHGEWVMFDRDDLEAVGFSGIDDLPAMLKALNRRVGA